MRQSILSLKVCLRKSGIGGKGLFAVENISKGEVMVDYSTGPGKYVKTAEADALYEEGNDYMLQVDDDLFFAATEERELEDADYINHSCDPNCGIAEALRIVALRDIGVGEEITFDYAMCESTDFSFRCGCGKPDCRKTVTGNDWKKPELQKKYGGYFSRYLQQKIVGCELSAITPLVSNREN